MTQYNIPFFSICLPISPPPKILFPTNSCGGMTSNCRVPWQKIYA